METWGREESCSYQNSFIRFIQTCLLEWERRGGSMCLTGIIWAGSTVMQALHCNVVLEKKDALILIKSCRNCRRVPRIAFSAFRPIGLAQLRAASWCMLGRQAIT